MHCCPGPHGATFSSERRPGMQRSHLAGCWPSPGSHPGPGVHESPPQSSSASHTAENVVFFQSFFFASHFYADHAIKCHFKESNTLSKRL